MYFYFPCTLSMSCPSVPRRNHILYWFCLADRMNLWSEMAIIQKIVSIGTRVGQGIFCWKTPCFLQNKEIPCKTFLIRAWGWILPTPVQPSYVRSQRTVERELAQSSLGCPRESARSRRAFEITTGTRPGFPRASGLASNKPMRLLGAFKLPEIGVSGWWLVGMEITK